jgi:hypothetical protein
MEITRTTDIWVETKRRFFVHQTQSNEQLLCASCAGQMITAEVSAALLGISRRLVYRLVEAEIVHFSETEAGVIFVCPDSFAHHLIKNKD